MLIGHLIGGALNLTIVLQVRGVVGDLSWCGGKAGCCLLNSLPFAFGIYAFIVHLPMPPPPTTQKILILGSGPGKGAATGGASDAVATDSKSGGTGTPAVKAAKAKARKAD